MPDWLSDPPTSVYLLVAVVAVGAVVYWYRTQTRRSLLIAAAILGGVGLWLALDEFYESPREEAVRRVDELIAAANEFRTERVAPHLSDRFEFHGMSKAAFLNAATWRIAEQNHASVAAWDFDRGYVQQPDANTLTIGFMARARGDGWDFTPFIQAKFVKDPDGAWRMKTFIAYSDPLRKANGPTLPVPGLP